MLSADSNNAEIWGLDIMLVPAVKLTFWKMSLIQTISAPATAGPSTVPYAAWAWDGGYGASANDPTLQ